MSKLSKILIITQVLVFIPLLLNASSPDISGKWNGCMNYGNNDCDIILEISSDDGGNLSAVLSIPKQDIVDLNAYIYIENNEIIIEQELKGIVFKGEIKDSSIEGIWKQQGMSLCLCFERS